MLTEKEVQKVKKSLKDNPLADGDRLSFVFEALSDPTRLKIFRLLFEQQDLCVTDLANVFEVSTPAISYQLRMMELTGLVEKERMGKMICYKLKKENPLVKKMQRLLS